MTAAFERRAYVVEPYVPNGGTLMAYHLGQILQQDFGFQAIAVSDSNTTSAHGVFRYALEMPRVTSAEMLARIRHDDLLIANPSFSALGLGFRARGTKLMYIQGFNTFELLDCRFDHYVSVSSFVQSFIRTTYGIETRVIPPFLSVDPTTALTPWTGRPERSFFVWNKGVHPLRGLAFERLRQLLPEFGLAPAFDGKVSHQEFLRELGANRYFITLSPAEGFGLPALEAMANGATVVGFDGFGGRDYMESGRNCLVRPFADVEGVAEALRALVADPVTAEALARAGRATAAEPRFGYEAFRNAWREEFERMLAAR